MDILSPTGKVIFALFYQHELDDFAGSDGFESWESMRDWFSKTYGLPFFGYLIKW